MKKIILFGFLLALAVSVSAFSMDINQYGFLKGQDFLVRGTCAQTISIRGFLAEKEVFSAAADCNNGSYALSQPISFLFPSGELAVVATEKTFSQTKKILVRPTRESSFLTILVGSPSQREISRTEKVTVSISLSDAKQPVENAVVQSWDSGGKPFFLPSVAPGVYSAVVPIPFDAPLKPWNLVVVAQAPSGSASQGLVGGEQSFSVPLVQAPIVLELASPLEQSLSVGKPILFRVKATYPDGSLLQSPLVLLSREDQNLLMEPKEPGFFEVSQSFSSQQAGLQRFVLTATDSAQNRSSKTVEFFVTEDFQSQSAALLPYLFSIGILVALVALVVVPRIRKQKNEKGMQKRKKEIEQELSALQKKYFEQNALNKDSFRQENMALEQELDEINKKLNTWKK